MTNELNLKSNISINIIELIENISKDYLQNVKENINILNNLLLELNLEDSTFQSYNNYIIFDDLIKKYHNESLEYALKNFINIDNKELLLWRFELTPIYKTMSYDTIDIFIEQCLNQGDENKKIPGYKFNDMIRLASLTNNFNKLILLKQQIQEGRLK